MKKFKVTIWVDPKPNSESTVEDVEKAIYKDLSSYSNELSQHMSDFIAIVEEVEAA